jgi:hypothetical protein
MSDPAVADPRIRLGIGLICMTDNWPSDSWPAELVGDYDED